MVSLRFPRDCSVVSSWCSDCDDYEEPGHRCPVTVERHDKNTDYWLYGQCKTCHRTVMIDFNTIALGNWTCAWCE